MSKNRKSRPLVMGSETEYALSGRSSRVAVRPEQLIGLVLQGARRYRHLPGSEDSAGLFLENGGRLYAEINGHPEYATPECRSPQEIAVYDRVGERLLAQVAERVRADSGSKIELTLTKTNLCPLLPDTVTHGNHESYTCWTALDEAADYLIPHLVTRLPYAGSGCLSGAQQGMGFELSQRARHLIRPTGASTTGDRGIFCTRVRYERDQSSTGWTRAHLIGKDSQRAPLGTYLTFGTTGLIFWVLNNGGRVGMGMKLRDPVESLRTVSQDPSLEKPLQLADGRSMTPVEIQRNYLDDCRAFGQHNELPDWAPALLEQWQQTLEVLADNPLDLAGKLDAYTKLWMYHHQLDRAGATWADVRLGMQLLRRLRGTVPAPLIQALIADDAQTLPPAQQSALEAAKQSLGEGGEVTHERLCLAVRMQALDFEYHKLGGLFEEMDRSGLIDTSIAPAEAVSPAMTEPPHDTRASARAALIREHQAQGGWTAGWDRIVGARGGKVIVLDDPFAAQSNAVPDGKDGTLAAGQVAARVRSLPSFFRT